MDKEKLTSSPSNPDSSASIDDLPVRGFLLFRLQEKLLAVELLELKNIIPWKKITPVPGSPPHYLGVISVRGTVVPILDFSVVLNGKPTTTDNKTTPFIIILHDGTESLGMPVETIIKIIKLGHEEILPVDMYIEEDNMELYSGIFRFNNVYGLIINFRKVISKTLDTINE